MDAQHTLPLHVSSLKNLAPSVVSLNASSKPVEETKRVPDQFFVATMNTSGEKQKYFGASNMCHTRVLAK